MGVLETTASVIQLLLILKFIVNKKGPIWMEELGQMLLKLMCMAAVGIWKCQKT